MTLAALNDEPFDHTGEIERLLRMVGLPVPEGETVRTTDDAWQAAQTIAGPVVVKPDAGNQGKGVSTNLTSEAEARSAFEIARRFGQEILVERFVEVIAIGLDEDTAAVVDHNLVMSVIGSGAITIVDGSSIKSDITERKDDEPLMVNGVELHVVTSHYCFDLRGRTFVPPL